VSSLEAYNWDTKQGREALQQMYRAVARQRKPLVEPPPLEPGDGDGDEPDGFVAAHPSHYYTLDF
jgi:hypothetical protein